MVARKDRTKEEVLRKIFTRLFHLVGMNPVDDVEKYNKRYTKHSPHRAKTIHISEWTKQIQILTSLLDKVLKSFEKNKEIDLANEKRKSIMDQIDLND